MTGHLQGKAALLHTETLHDGWAKFMMVTVRLEDGAEVRRELEHHGRACGVLAYDPERRVALLVRQLRMGPLVAGAAEPHLIEALAGMIEDGESAEDAARREAMEETGVRLGELESYGAPFSTAGVSTEQIELFLAAYTARDRVGPGGGAEGEHENIRVLELPLAELLADALAGRMRDLKTLALVLMLNARRPELFAPA